MQLLPEHRERTLLQIISVNNQPVFLAKQANSPETVVNIAQELRVYTCLQQIPALAGHVPPLFAGDSRGGLIVLGWINHEPATDLLHRHTVQDQLGTQLGALHSATLPLSSQLNPVKKPWVFSMLSPVPEWQPEELPVVLGQGTNQDILSHGLNRAARAWSPDSLIHADLKQEHCLPVQDNGEERVYLIDWELAGIGDSAWDVASIVSDILFGRVYEFGEQKHFGTLGVEDLLASFLNSYADIHPIDHVFLHKVALFTGGRLLQTSLESAAVYGVGEQSGVALLVPMAEEIFADLDSFVSLLLQGCTV